MFSSLDDIDPSKIVPHEWKKLRAIWKGLNSEYKAAVARFLLSGTHTSDFYSFCNGKQDVYYLRKHLELKPELVNTVEADLPEDTFIENGKEREKSPDSSNSSKQKRTGTGNEIAEVLQEINNSKMQTEIAKQKLDLLESAEQRQMKEEKRKEKEEERRERQQLFDK